MEGKPKEVEEALAAIPIGITAPNNLLNAAFIKAQGSFPVIEKGKSTAYKNVKFAWADLGAIRAAINPILSDNGLGAFQDVETTGRGVRVRTTLIHASGQEKVSSWLELNAPSDPKQVGGSITYACRYQFVAFLNIPVQGEDDIDQHSGEKNNRPAASPQKNDPSPIQYLFHAVDQTSGVWGMGDCQRYYRQKSGKDWPPKDSDTEAWKHLIETVKSGIDPREVIK